MDYSYDQLIKKWFDKSENEKDYFTKFIFLFISFIAFTSQRYGDVEHDCAKKKEFIAEADAKNYYQYLINTTPQLKENIINLISYLDTHPITNSTRKFDLWDGKIASIRDWSNLVEYWFRVRNNLFHGHKSPEAERDQKLVEFAYKTLHPLMKNFIDNDLVWKFQNKVIY